MNTLNKYGIFTRDINYLTLDAIYRNVTVEMSLQQMKNLITSVLYDLCINYKASDINNFEKRILAASVMNQPDVKRRLPCLF